MDRSARALAAIALLTVAGFLGAELLIRRAPVGEWALAAVLALAGLALLWLGMRPERAPAVAAAPEPLMNLATVPALAGAPAVALPEPALSVPAVVVEPAPLPEPVPAEPENLTVIDGIGPKTAEALHRSGVRTFGQMAAMTGAALRDLLAAQNVRIVGDSIDTWPEQAALMAAGDVAGLKAWIAAHKGHSSGD